MCIIDYRSESKKGFGSSGGGTCSKDDSDFSDDDNETRK